MKWKVGKSKVHGNGVFAAQDLNRGEDVGVSIPMIKDTETERIFQRNTFGLLINDSSTPNVRCMKIEGDWHFVAITPIQEGDELLVDYNDYGDKVELESFIAGKRVAVV